MVSRYPVRAMAAASEDFVKDKIREAEERWKAELGKMKEDMEQLK